MDSKKDWEAHISRLGKTWDVYRATGSYLEAFHCMMHLLKECVDRGEKTITEDFMIIQMFAKSHWEQKKFRETKQKNSEE